MSGPLSLDDRDGISIFRRRLADADYAPAGIRKALGVEFNQTVPISELPLMLKSLPPGDLSTLVRLFDFAVPVEPDAVARALAPLTLERLERMGVIRPSSEGVTGGIRLKPFQGGVFASDRRLDLAADPPADFVLDVNATSVELAHFTPRRRFKTALDLGCGCGVLAVLAAAHCDRVIATDINPRALNFTAFNALLNGVTNVECLEGSLMAPVARRSFDLIMSNPPFVVSPDSGLQYRDSGMKLDSFCRELVRQIPDRLNEGGIAVVLCNWVLRQGQAWTAPPAEWISGGGCDAVVFRSHAESPAEYAGAWNHPLAGYRQRDYEAALDRWIGHFRELGVESIVAGRIAMRKRNAKENWIFTIDGSVEHTPAAGDHVLRIIEAQSWLNQAVRDADVEAAVFQPEEDLRLDQSLAFRDGGLAPVHAEVRLDAGFLFRSPADPVSWSFLSKCDGRRTVGEIADDIASETGQVKEKVRTRIVAAVRDLYSTGFLARS